MVADRVLCVYKVEGLYVLYIFFFWMMGEVGGTAFYTISISFGGSSWRKGGTDLGGYSVGLEVLWASSARHTAPTC